MSVLTNIDMNLASKTIKGMFKFGRLKSIEIEFNELTTIEDVYDHIRHLFNDVLPSKFHVKFYSFEAKDVFVLDGNLLDSENNPFRLDPSDTGEKTTSTMDCVEFLIVDDSLRDNQTNLESNSLLDTLSAHDLDEAIFNTTFLDDLDEALLPSPLVPNSSDEVISHNNVATKDEDEEDIIMNENLAAESSSDPQITSSSSSSLNEYGLATETTDEKATQSCRIVFSHDVHPKQKHHYLTNQFSIDGRPSKNGGISFVQGLKTEEEIEKKLQVLPHLLIPSLYRLMREFILLIYAVYEEELEDGTRIWYKNQHKGFLQAHQLTADAEFLNPIRLVLNHTSWTKDGDYPLEMYMLTKRNKTRKEKEEIHRLSKLETAQIHQAEHVKCSTRKPVKPTRLFCAREINHRPYLPSFGLSDFIQPPMKKSGLPDLNHAGQIALPVININLSASGLSNRFQINRGNLPSVRLTTMTSVRMVSPSPKRQKIE